MLLPIDTKWTNNSLSTGFDMAALVINSDDVMSFIHKL